MGARHEQTIPNDDAQHRCAFIVQFEHLECQGSRFQKKWLEI